MKKIVVLLAASLIALNIHAQKINTGASKVSFSVSNLKVNTVDGTITGMKGDVVFNEAKPEKSSFNVSINVNTIETGIEKRDNHLKNEDFFEVSKYPTISFRSSDVVKTSSGYKTTGTLTIKDVSRKITIPFDVSGNTLKGNISINRKTYHVGTDVSTFTVGEDIAVTIVCVLD